jgi:hypothetical protein
MIRWKAMDERRLLHTGVAALMLISAAMGAAGQGKQERAPVVLDGETLFYLYARVGSFTPRERARVVSDRLLAIARRDSFPTDQITVGSAADKADILAGEDSLVSSGAVANMVAGVEIMSPSYSALRDGNTTTIPEENRPEGYNVPAFRIRTGAEADYDNT